MIRVTTPVNEQSYLIPGKSPSDLSRKWENYRVEWEKEEEEFKKQIRNQLPKDYHKYGACSPTERFIWSINNKESETNRYQSVDRICYKEVIINGKDIPSEILASKTITVAKQVVLENCMFLNFPNNFSFQFYHGSVHTGRLGVNGQVILEQSYVAREKGGATAPITIANESKKPSFLSSLCGCCFGWQASQNNYEPLGEELPSPVRAESDTVDFMSSVHKMDHESYQVAEGEPPSPSSTENEHAYCSADFEYALNSYESANIGANSTTLTTMVNTAQNTRSSRLLEIMKKSRKHHPTLLTIVASHMKS